MRRLVLVTAALACGGIASAQQARWDQFPVTAPVRHAGTVDIATGEWSRAPAGPQEAGGTVLYDNTCVWSGGAFYAGLESCEVLYDEGRLPGTGDPNPPAGAADTYQLRCFDIAYCTFHPAPFMAKVGFWNNLGGPCAGGAPPTPPPPSTTATAYFDLSSLGLPGSTASGFQACWIVTVDVSNVAPVMLANGNGVFQGNQATDLFTWSFEHASPIHPSARTA